MIDFGFLPNESLKQESNRSRDLYESGELEHPYTEWLAVSRWEGGSNGYLFVTDPEFPKHVLCVELYGVEIPNIGSLIILYDMVTMVTHDNGDTRLSPAQFSTPQTDEDLKARGSNSLDPLVTMLRILADASVLIIDHPAPERLNKVRVRSGKYAIPAYTEVKTADYVAAFRSAKPKSVSKGGSHASPIAHWRRHHLRHLSSGKVVPVRQTKVNWRQSEEMHRLFYRTVRPKPSEEKFLKGGTENEKVDNNH